MHLTARQVANRLGYSEGHVYALMRAGKLPRVTVTVGPFSREEWRVPAQFVEQLEARMQQGGDAA